MRRFVRLGAFCLSAVLVHAGCHSHTNQAPLPSQQLREICLAYVNATDKLERPPANRAELVKYLSPQANGEAVFKSSNDGEEFVILWGVDYRGVSAGGQAPPVMVYEKVGKNGKRFVARFRNVIEMTDEEFQKAPFPPGHAAPK